MLPSWRIGASRVTVPLEPQPPGPLYDDGTGRWSPAGVWGGPDWFLPYQPGDRIPVREEWELLAVMTDRKRPVTHTAYVVYGGGDLQSAEPARVAVDADTAREWGDRILRDQNPRWRHASEMPDWAVRHWCVIESPGQVYRVRRLSYEDWLKECSPSYDDRSRALAMGTGQAFLHEYLRRLWNADHPGVPFERAWGVAYQVRWESKGC